MATTSTPSEKDWRVRGVTPAPAPSKAASPMAQMQSQVKALSDKVERLTRSNSSGDNRLQAQVNGLSKDVDRLNRTTHADALEAQYQAVQSMLQGTFALASEIEALTHQQARQAVDVEDAFYQHEKRRRRLEVAGHLDNIAKLASAKQEITPVCTCGKHKGITFTLPNGYVMEKDMCPKDWWFKQSRLAFRHGELSSFLSSYPFEDYLYAYRLA